SADLLFTLAAKSSTATRDSACHVYFHNGRVPFRAAIDIWPIAQDRMASGWTYEVRFAACPLSLSRRGGSSPLLTPRLALCGPAPRLAHRLRSPIGRAIGTGDQKGRTQDRTL